VLCPGPLDGEVLRVAPSRSGPLRAARGAVVLLAVRGGRPAVQPTVGVGVATVVEMGDEGWRWSGQEHEAGWRNMFQASALFSVASPAAFLKALPR
jgi:hypothetical protein